MKTHWTKSLGGTDLALSLPKAAKYMGELTGFTPSRTTMWRWYLKGRLECRRIGNNVYTTATAIEKMIAADELNNASSIEARAAAAADAIRAELDGEVAA